MDSDEPGLDRSRLAGLSRNRRWKPPSKRPSSFAISILSVTSKLRTLLTTTFESNETIRLLDCAFATAAKSRDPETRAIISALLIFVARLTSAQAFLLTFMATAKTASLQAVKRSTL